MGLLFETQDGCQIELFLNGGTDGVSYVNLVTSIRTYINKMNEIPQDWPQNVKDMIRPGSLRQQDLCHICLQPQNPLCTCLLTMDGEYDAWCTPRVLERIDPPTPIDNLPHLMCQAKKSIELMCIAKKADRSTLAQKAIDLVGQYVTRQRLIAQVTGDHYARAANVLRNYAQQVAGEITNLRQRVKDNFRDSRRDVIAALFREKTCDSCMQERMDLCVLVPCMHAPICLQCLKRWSEASKPVTCPVCRQVVGTARVVHACQTIDFLVDQ